MYVFNAFVSPSVKPDLKGRDRVPSTVCLLKFVSGSTGFLCKVTFQTKSLCYCFCAPDIARDVLTLRSYQPSVWNSDLTDCPVFSCAPSNKPSFVTWNSCHPHLGSHSSAQYDGSYVSLCNSYPRTQQVAENNKDVLSCGFCGPEIVRGQAAYWWTFFAWPNSC